MLLWNNSPYLNELSQNQPNLIYYRAKPVQNQIHLFKHTRWITVKKRKKKHLQQERAGEKECLLPPQMKWLCGWMYMWVQAARSYEWEVGTEWEEKSCFSETISTKTHWKAVTLSWLFFVFRVPGSEVGYGWLVKVSVCIEHVCMYRGQLMVCPIISHIIMMSFYRRLHRNRIK